MKQNLKVKHLITESDMHDYDLIKESTGDGSTLLKLAGPFAVCETLNNNNRMYHLEEMEIDYALTYLTTVLFLKS